MCILFYAYKIKLLRDIIHKGIEIVYIQADISNEKMISSKLQLYNQEIKGVFFAAGLSDINNFNPILSLNSENSEMQFNSKLNGILAIDNILNQSQLDFYVISSSISTILGGLGFGAYNAANFFLDTYSSMLKNRGFQKVITINWDAWKIEDTRENEEFLKIIKKSNDKEIENSKLDHTKGLEMLKKF